ncbi:nucleotide disphospho-sugar-binding domain-containing protein [Agromyces sp. SYSU T00266]|uniref:nucleotide disphospho-sugar-binding domain-containing protein n=1 Tax=Agromyces zhanjiangensis TaxID=3158562 RepID=UPI0033994992
MSSILLCAMPLDGHVRPMLEVGRVLVGDGHSVRFLTGGAYSDAVAAVGAEHVPLAAASDITPAMLDAGRQRDGERLSGIRAAIDNTHRNFIATLPGWIDAIRAEIDGGIDLILAEATVFALGAVCGLPREDRPPVIACGAFPVVLLSRDAAPPMLGLPPRSDAIGRIRNRVLNAVVTRVVFRGLQRDADAVAMDRTGRRLPAFLTEWPRVADRYLQFSVPSFEYPRSDAPDTLRFIGPLASPKAGERLPSWWSDLRAAEVVVYVSQGTLANRDFDELIRPTIGAFADRPDVLVVVTTGGRPVSDLGPVPSNVRVARMLDDDRLMPLVDVFVTNGGYGGLNHALAHGVPIVAAGDTEEKVETCARVEWSGVGLDLRTGTPRSGDIEDAVRRVLDDPRHRRAAERIRDDISEAPRERGLLEAVGAVLAPA